MLDGVFAGLAVENFSLRVHPAQEQLAVPLDHLADSRAFDNVGANSQDAHAWTETR
jgi:hypothetical protein